MRIVILGAKGMAGHMVSMYFLQNTNWEVLSFDREKFSVDDSKLWMANIAAIGQADYIINCIGAVKPIANSNHELAIKINSLFPHQLVHEATKINARVIHLSTDCWEDLDIYGRSKRAGEINLDNHLTLRTSIIGPELKDGTGLFHWFITQEKPVLGFSNHFWDGVTTLQLSNEIIKIIESGMIGGIVDLRTRGRIDKFSILKYLKTIFGKEIEIKQKETEIVDKTNSEPDIICEEDFEKQFVDMKNWIIDNSLVYSQYSNFVEKICI